MKKINKAKTGKLLIICDLLVFDFEGRSPSLIHDEIRGKLGISDRTVDRYIDEINLILSFISTNYNFIYKNKLNNRYDYKEYISNNHLMKEQIKEEHYKKLSKGKDFYKIAKKPIIIGGC